jgi:hypothetical protein
MSLFAFIFTTEDGAETYEEHEFSLRSDAIAAGRSRLLSAERVSIGRIEGPNVEWLGGWRLEDGPAFWEPANDAGGGRLQPAR